jgi:hypothetical protein
VQAIVNELGSNGDNFAVTTFRAVERLDLGKKWDAEKQSV